MVQESTFWVWHETKRNETNQSYGKSIQYKINISSIIIFHLKYKYGNLFTDILNFGVMVGGRAGVRSDDDGGGGGGGYDG